MPHVVQCSLTISAITLCVVLVKAALCVQIAAPIVRFLQVCRALSISFAVLGWNVVGLITGVTELVYQYLFPSILPLLQKMDQESCCLVTVNAT